jgi:hypothetical protein
MNPDRRRPTRPLRRTLVPALLLAALLAAGAPATGVPAAPSTKSSSAKPATPATRAKPAPPPRRATFSFVCATPAVSFPPKVREVAARLAKEQKSDGGKSWGDRAVALRLRKGDAPTYFVPLACGATGQCSWGIVGATPAKSLGVVSGAVISVETAAPAWPAIQVFSSAGSGQARVDTLRLSDGQYRPRPAERTAAEAIDRLRSCFDNASCCPRLE